MQVGTASGMASDALMHKTAATTEPAATASGTQKQPPPLPHITMNMTPLNVIVERIAQDAYKRLCEYFKYAENDQGADAVKKKQLLDLLVGVRENFLRLYVLCKWSINHEQIGKLIDVFVWLRDINQQISNNIGTFGAMKGSLISAKMPEPDLLTSLEVMLTGRPNLPTYNYIETGVSDGISPEFALKLLRNLNVELSIKLSQQQDIPAPFQKYQIKNGCVKFHVPNQFTCLLSLLHDGRFHLVDFHLNFREGTEDEGLVIKQINEDSNEKRKPLDMNTMHSIQNLSNRALGNKEEEGNLQNLYEVLNNYAVSAKTHLLHKQLVKLRMGLWRGHLTHKFNATECKLIVTYWMHRKFAKPSTIEISKVPVNVDGSNHSGYKLSLKWTREGVPQTVMPLPLENEVGTIDILQTITTIIQKHIKNIIANLKAALINTVADVEKKILATDSKLIYKISQFKQVVYGIDLLSGGCYFENPTNTMNKSSYLINTGQSADFVEILRLKMLVEDSQVQSMMNATSWVHMKCARLGKDEVEKLDVTSSPNAGQEAEGNVSKLKNPLLRNVLTSLQLYRRREWPIGWAIIVGHFGFQSLRVWCCKVQSIEGVWVLNWSDSVDLHELTPSSLTSTSDAPGDDSEVEALEVRKLSYDDLISLIKLTTSKLISSLIVKELQDFGGLVKPLNSNDELVQKFLAKHFSITCTREARDDTTVMLLKNRSLVSIENARDSLVMLISIKNNELDTQIYGSLTTSGAIPEVSYEDEDGSVRYDPKTEVFQVSASVDLSKGLKSSSRAVTVTDSNEPDMKGLVLGGVIQLLRRFAKLLNVVRVVGAMKGLNILKVFRDGVQFQYGTSEEHLTLKFETSGCVNVEFSLEGWARRALEKSVYIREVLSGSGVNNRSIRELVQYVRDTAGWTIFVDKLLEEQHTMLTNFNESNEAVDIEKGGEVVITPPFSWIVFAESVESVRICYTRTIPKISKRDRIEIAARMRRRRGRTVFIFSAMVDVEDTLRVNEQVAAIFSGIKDTIQTAPMEIIVDGANVVEVADTVHRGVCGTMM
jgi:mediator of RNA polymerase II transcription subunit 14